MSMFKIALALSMVLGSQAFASVSATGNTYDMPAASAANRAKVACTPLNADCTKINSESLPATLATLVNQSTMINTLQADGQQLLVFQGVRRAGTRVGVHYHEYGGHSCVLSGEITDYVEGQAPSKFPAGTCYYMPPWTLMSATNLGSEDAVLIDTFVVPPDKPFITIVEENLVQGYFGGASHLPPPSY